MSGYVEFRGDQIERLVMREVDRRMGSTHLRLLQVISCCALLVTVILVPYFRVRDFQQVLLYLPGIDKVAHYLIHIGIVLGAYSLLGYARFRRPGWRLVTAVAISLTIALIDETAQRYSSSRNFELTDLGANLLGAVTASAILSRNRIGIPGVVLVVLISGSLAAALIADSYHKQQPYFQGQRFEKQKNYVLARKYYLQAVAAGNTSAGLFNDLAWLEVEFLDGNPAVALSYVEQAFQRSSHNAGVLDTYGWVLYLLGKYDRALELLKRAEKLDPGIYCIHYHLGMTRLALGDREKARFHLERQVLQNSDDRYGKLALEALTTLQP